MNTEMHKGRDIGQENKKTVNWLLEQLDSDCYVYMVIPQEDVEVEPGVVIHQDINFCDLYFGNRKSKENHEIHIHVDSTEPTKEKILETIALHSTFLRNIDDSFFQRIYSKFSNIISPNNEINKETIKFLLNLKHKLKNLWEIDAIPKTDSIYISLFYIKERGRLSLELGYEEILNYELLFKLIDVEINKEMKFFSQFYKEFRANVEILYMNDKLDSELKQKENNTKKSKI